MPTVRCVLLPKQATRGRHSRRLDSKPGLSYTPRRPPRLEFIDLILPVPQLLQHARQLALLRHALLRPAHRLVQARRPAHEDLDVLLPGLRQHRLEQLGRDVPLALRPALGRPVEDVEGAEAVRVGVLEVLELGLEQDVGLGQVAEDEGDLGPVGRVLEDGARELVHSVFRSPERDCQRGTTLAVIIAGVWGEERAGR